MALEAETKAELSRAGARMLSASAGRGGVEGNGKQDLVGERPHRAPMIASLRSMQQRSNDNWERLIEAIGTFVNEQRGLADAAERWLGTK